MSKHPRKKKIKKSNNYLKVGDTIYFLCGSDNQSRINYDIYRALMARTIKQIYKDSDGDVILDLGYPNNEVSITMYSRTLDGLPLTDKDFNI